MANYGLLLMGLFPVVISAVKVEKYYTAVQLSGMTLVLIPRSVFGSITSCGTTRHMTFAITAIAKHERIKVKA